MSRGSWWYTPSGRASKLELPLNIHLCIKHMRFMIVMMANIIRMGLIQKCMFKTHTSYECERLCKHINNYILEQPASSLLLFPWHIAAHLGTVVTSLPHKTQPNNCNKYSSSQDTLSHAIRRNARRQIQCCVRVSAGCVCLASRDLTAARPLDDNIEINRM